MGKGGQEAGSGGGGPGGGQQVPESGPGTEPGRAEVEEVVSAVGLRPDRGDIGLSHVWVWSREVV